MSHAVTQDQDRWIWPFELQEKIGEGGMGVVYRARYVKDDRPVAVKLLPAEVTDEVILARFERELEILRTMRHPNIVRCFGGVCENKRRFYAMELVEGGTLDELLATQGRLPWQQAVEYGLQMCAALAYAHERGVTHRDVKPGNFLIARDGQLKLSDFGLASVEAARKITKAGKTMGTYRYMSPEQIRGRAEPRTDLYALGCVLFELLAGRTPFLGDTPAEILNKHMKEEPPRVSAFVAGVPPALEQLVSDLLQKDPDQRPQTAVEVAKRLNAASEIVAVAKPQFGATVSSRPTPAREQTARPEPARQVSTPLWVWGAGLAVITTLLLWNLGLRGGRAAFEESESLWISAFESGQPGVRETAASALARLSNHSDRAVEALVAGLSSEDIQTRQASVRALGETGRRDLIPTLVKVQHNDGEPLVTAEATSAVTKLKGAEGRGSSRTWLLGTLIVAVAAGTFGWLWWRAAER